MRIRERPSKIQSIRDDGYHQMSEPYSNLRAATILGKPETSAIISHGRSESRDVRTAPPFASPLCCLRRLGGFGVEPIYSDACRTVERST